MRAMPGVPGTETRNFYGYMFLTAVRLACAWVGGLHAKQNEADEL